ncbi:putative prenylated rab acceptor P [Arabidopsis thaliana]
MTRFWKNSSYFRVNYVCIIALILSFSLPAHPFSLILLLCLAASWLFVTPVSRVRKTSRRPATVYSSSRLFPAEPLKFSRFNIELPLRGLILKSLSYYTAEVFLTLV